MHLMPPTEAVPFKFCNSNGAQKRVMLLLGDHNSLTVYTFV